MTQLAFELPPSRPAAIVLVADDERELDRIDDHDAEGAEAMRQDAIYDAWRDEALS